MYLHEEEIMRKLLVLLVAIVFGLTLAACDGTTEPDLESCETGFTYNDETQECEEDSPITCEVYEELENDECVEKTCPAGEELDMSTGECDSICLEDEEFVNDECTPIVTDADIVTEAIEALVLDFETITENVELPGVALHDLIITWTTSNEDVLTIDGVVPKSFC